MSQRAAFRQAILDDPDDDAPRLVYADWLDDHGEHDRAEFIRVQVERARVVEGDPALRPTERGRGWLRPPGAAWRKEVPSWPRRSPDWVVLRRGFVDEVRCRPATFIDR